MSRHLPAVALALIGALALALRLPSFGDSIAGDELVTFFEVTGHGPRRVLELVRSDIEVTPPLFALLVEATSWVSDQLRWVSLIAGLVSLPLTYALGVRTVGVRAALVACAVMALSPFLVFFSTEARPYALMMALCLASSLTLLLAVEEDRRRWWLLYAAFACAAMYTHYTAIFVLAGQAAWALAAHPALWRRLALSTAGAAVAYLPWLPSYLEDSDSPGSSLIAVLQPFSADAVRTNVLQWSIGHPAVDSVSTMPGRPAVALVAAGLLLGTAATAGEAVRRRPPLRALVTDPRTLVVVLALATPVLAALYSAVEVSVYLPRNLIASSPGLALLMGFLVTRSTRPWVLLPATAMVLAGFAIGAAKVLPESAHRPDYDGVARFIDDRDRGSVVVVDAPGLTAGPLSLLDVALARRGDRRPVPRLGRTPRDVQLSAFRPGGPGQYASLPVPSGATVARRAERAEPDMILLVSPGAIPFRRLTGRQGSRRARAEFAASGQAMFIRALPERLRYRGMRIFPGLFGRQPVSVYVFED